MIKNVKREVPENTNPEIQMAEIKKNIAPNSCMQSETEDEVLSYRLRVWLLCILTFAE